LINIYVHAAGIGKLDHTVWDFEKNCMPKISSKYIGSVVLIPLSDNTYCYASILEGLSFAFYDYRTDFKDKDIGKITSTDILFVALVHFKVLNQSNWEIVGKKELDSRHKKMPVFYHPDIMNAEIYDYTLKKLKETLIYKTYEKRGMQDGSIYSASHIIDRLEDYYAGRDYNGILQLIVMVENFKAKNNK